MRLALRSLAFGQMCLLYAALAAAQNPQPIPLQLSGEARPTQLPPLATLAGAQCDSSGTVYLRYAIPAKASYSLAIAKLDPDGTTQTVSFADLPGAVGENHAFIFAPAGDGTLHEIVRAQSSNEDNAATEIDYVRFDPDGSIRSTADFEQEFIPSALVPLPSGNFFASGVTIKPSGNGVAENALAGIFSPDAKLLQPLRAESAIGEKKGDTSDDAAALLQGGSARLGGDGNIYALLSGDHADVAVIRQSGRIQRVLHLQPPSDSFAPDDMWASGGRLLVSYSGDSGDGNDSQTYVLYDASTGAEIRSYKAEFTGTPACFQDGQILTVLIRQPSSGNIAIGSAELQ